MLGDGSDCEIRRLRVWLNAFIPEHIEGLTLEIPAGEFAGKTAIPHPARQKWVYLTDQRSFSSDRGPDTKSRVHSEIDFDIPSRTVVGESRGSHWSSPTVELLRRTWAATGAPKVGAVDRVAFGGPLVEDLRTPGDRRVVRVDLRGAVSNPASPSARLFGDIDFEGTLELRINEQQPQRIDVRFVGKIEPFPAFEMYAAADAGQPVTIFKRPPEPGTSTRNLPRRASRAIDAWESVLCIEAERAQESQEAPVAPVIAVAGLGTLAEAKDGAAVAFAGLGTLAEAKERWSWRSYRINEIRRVASAVCEDPEALGSADLSDWDKWFPHGDEFSESDLDGLDGCARRSARFLLRLNEGIRPGIAAGVRTIAGLVQEIAGVRTLLEDARADARSARENLRQRMSMQASPAPWNPPPAPRREKLRFWSEELQTWVVEIPDQET